MFCKSSTDAADPNGNLGIISREKRLWLLVASFVSTSCVDGMMSVPVLMVLMLEAVL